MSTTTLARESRETRPLYVHAEKIDGDGIDPTTFPVFVAAAEEGERPADWKTIAWSDAGLIVGPDDLGAAYRADFTVGGPDTGGDLELAAGTWDIYGRVTTGDEDVVLFAGTITVL